MSLANLIQVNCQEMRAARLTLNAHGQKGEVYLSDGQVVHAALGDHSGAEAVWEMLAWDDGNFLLDLDQRAPEKTIASTWQELLLQGMMRLPERQTTEEKVGRSMSNELLAQLRAIEGVNGAVIASCDGVVLAAGVPEGDGEAEAAVAVFVGSAANQLGEMLQLGGFAHGTVGLRNRRVLILEQPDRYVGLVLAENASPAIVANAAAQALKQ
jgi:predicted regulator of Ras-like GTPase activity (Roadblock/LC7/MglB family)